METLDVFSFMPWLSIAVDCCMVLDGNGRQWYGNGTAMDGNGTAMGGNGTAMVPNAWYRILGTKYLYQVLGTKYLVPSTWYQVLGTMYLYEVLGAKFDLNLHRSTDVGFHSMVKCLSKISFHDLPYIYIYVYIYTCSHVLHV